MKAPILIFMLTERDRTILNAQRNLSWSQARRFSFRGIALCWILPIKLVLEVPKPAKLIKQYKSVPNVFAKNQLLAAGVLTFLRQDLGLPVPLDPPGKTVT